MSNKVVDCVVGLQWGSEGKGKIVSYLADEYNAMVRSGGPQAGHTFYSNENKYINRQIPCGVSNPECKLYLGSNSLINLDVLIKEINTYGITPENLIIDNHAMIVTHKHEDIERKSTLEKRLASTLEGVGAAQVEKVWRKAKLFNSYARENPELYFFCQDTVETLNYQIKHENSILLEGTQGFGLSLNLGSYPYVTSRDVVVSTLLSDAGIAPNHHRQTIGVMRTYPIRVGGNSGDTNSEELNWTEISKRSGAPNSISEKTTVTGRTRRVFEQSFDVLFRANQVNKPDQIALMFLDYINHEDFGKNSFDSLSNKSKTYIDEMERILEIPITLIGTGPEEFDMIDRRTPEQKAIPKEDCGMGDWFPDNINGADWDSKFHQRFLDRKMTNPDGSPYTRRIF